MDHAALTLAPLLDLLVNYERTRPDKRLWDLATMRLQLARLDLPAAPRPAVQVGGSKGKGTTCAFLAGLVQAGQGVAGVYTSPHTTTLLERIRCGDQQVDLATLDRLLRRVLAVPTGERALTFFEAMTLCAANWFAERRVDLAIYEVGLGGRHDATTALPVDAGIVTMIELEHTDVLGDTIGAIAAEKAPVIRAGGIGFTGTTGEALAVVRAHAEQVGAQLFVLGEQFGWRPMLWSDEGCRSTLWLPDGRELPVFLPGARAFEMPALALAVATLARLMPDLPLQLDPAPRPTLPCRFEILREADGEVLVLDGAHTEQSLALVAAELARRWPRRRCAVLFGSATGKRWREGLSALLPIADRFVVTEISGTASEDPAAIAAFAASLGVASEVATDIEHALAALRRGPGPRLVAGSFYLAGQVRELVTAAARPDRP